MSAHRTLGIASTAVVLPASILLTAYSAHAWAAPIAQSEIVGWIAAVIVGALVLHATATAGAAVYNVRARAYGLAVVQTAYALVVMAGAVMADHRMVISHFGSADDRAEITEIGRGDVVARRETARAAFDAAKAAETAATAALTSAQGLMDAEAAVVGGDGVGTGPRWEQRRAERDAAQATLDKRSAERAAALEALQAALAETPTAAGDDVTVALATSDLERSVIGFALSITLHAGAIGGALLLATARSPDEIAGAVVAQASAARERAVSDTHADLLRDMQAMVLEQKRERERLADELRRRDYSEDLRREDERRRRDAEWATPTADPGLPPRLGPEGVRPTREYREPTVDDRAAVDRAARRAASLVDPRGAGALRAALGPANIAARRAAQAQRDADEDGRSAEILRIPAPRRDEEEGEP